MVIYNEVPDELKDPHHVLPVEVWAKVQQDAEIYAKEAD